MSNSSLDKKEKVSDSLKNDEQLQQLRDKVTSYQDFPKKGILFRDIFSLLYDPHSFKTLSKLLEEEIKSYCPDVDIIVGLDSRGFILASVLSLYFMKPFVPIRKKGKLPGDVASLDFSLEYGKDTFELQKTSIKTGQKVVIVDDLLATGGTMKAAAQLVTSVGGNVCICLVCVELCDLNGRDIVKFPVHSLLKF